MSDIMGSGWGFDHDWKCLGTPYSGVTHYKCKACETRFTHYYNHTPEIGKAMHASGVPEHCPAIAALEEPTP